MSLWNSAPHLAQGAFDTTKVTVPALLDRKRSGHRIAAVTAYDHPSAVLADKAGIDLVLVGDSLAMAVLGHATTLEVTMDEMLVFTRAVRRGLARALLVADMPFGSYHTGEVQGVANAVRFVKEAGAEAVKLEGSHPGLVQRLVEAEIPVVGHLGLTPQSIHRMGGYKVQARSHDTIVRLNEQAHALADAGCCALVLEGIPREVAAKLTAELTIPIIGIGAGPDCDGQILVWHDLLGIGEHPTPRFVRPYLHAGTQIAVALEQYVADVQTGAFPNDAESYHLPSSRELTLA
jgi:3-methyl-2-oxobutanoate hydroxymethyltransferase